MLYGPMTLLFYDKLARYIRNRRKQHDILQQACMWTIISGLGFLSFAPHQEPRFLTPILVPLAILVGDTNLWSSVRLRSIWIGFNILFLVVFGILHQGGIVRAILSSTITHDAPQSIIFHHTYMPPSFLLRRLQCTDVNVCSTNSCPLTSINDLMGTSGQNLALALQRELHCDGNDENRTVRHVHLVTPPLPLDDGVQFSTNSCNIGSHFSCESIWTHWPHLTTEDLPVFEGLSPFVQSFKLTIYTVGCK